MASVKITIPGKAGIVEAKKARLAAAVAHQFNLVMAARQAMPSRPSAGDLGKPRQTARLA